MVREYRSSYVIRYQWPFRSAPARLHILRLCRTVVAAVLPHEVEDACHRVNILSLNRRHCYSKHEGANADFNISHSLADENSFAFLQADMLLRWPLGREVE